MIFVMLGTQKQQFTRLLDLIENSKELANEEIIVQGGNTKYTSNKMRIFEFVSPQDFEKYIKESSYIISHGGVGSILTALKSNKKILVVPRLKKYNEHINNHQIEICEQLESKQNLLCYHEEENFDDDVIKLRNTDFKEYVVDKSFLDKLRKEI